jgi:hypothetical protein
MTFRDILRQRLSNQQLVTPEFETAGEVVRHLGAVQAQDYFGSLWAVGQRMKISDDALIEKAVADKSIVRSWPMRGTLHFVPPEDLRWMLALLTPRVLKKAAKPYRDAGLDSVVFKKSAKILERVLQGGNQLTRNEIYDILEKAKISTANYRGLHILGHAALTGLVCLGPRKGKQPTFTLLDEWLPVTKPLKEDEAIARLALKYFNGHSPASAQDFSWWSGLSLTEARKGIDMISSHLSEEIAADKSYWYMSSGEVPKQIPKTALLLPTYDEYIVGYEDRSELVHANYKSSSGQKKEIVFSSTIVYGGLVIATWKRTVKKDHILVEVMPLTKLTKAQQGAIGSACKKYGKFFGSRVVVKQAKLK